MNFRSFHESKSQYKRERKYSGVVFNGEERLFVYGENSIMAIDNGFRTVWENTDGFSITAANVMKFSSGSF